MLAVAPVGSKAKAPSFGPGAETPALGSVNDDFAGADQLNMTE